MDKNKRILKNTVQAKGNIVLDGLKYLPKKNENSIFTLLYATQPQPVMSQRLKSISDFTDAILKFDPINIKVIIRLHPREVFDYELYNLFFEKLNQFEVEIDKGEELFSQINKTDVLVTSYSTVSKDAIILNTPIILQDYYENDITGLISKGIAKKSTNSEELFCLINDIKTGNFKINIINYENVLKEIYASTDFKVANEIIKMLN